MMGIKEQILEAETPEQVAQLLAQGKTYRMASEPTVRRWKTAAKQRLEELASVKPAK